MPLVDGEAKVTFQGKKVGALEVGQFALDTLFAAMETAKSYPDAAQAQAEVGKGLVQLANFLLAASSLDTATSETLAETTDSSNDE